MHRAEEIIATVAQLLTGLPTTGPRVERGQVYDGHAASLSIDMGGEDPVEQSNTAGQYEHLDILITARVKAPQGQTDTALNQIAAEVYAALMATRNMGLAYVSRITWQGRAAPQREIADQTASTQVMRVQVQYRHSFASAEA